VQTRTILYRAHARAREPRPVPLGSIARWRLVPGARRSPWQPQKSCQPRASRVQAMSAGNKTPFHLPDGPEQQERDAQMATGSTDWSKTAIASIFEHDATRLEP
jgi:hypothetical protein